MNEILEIIGKHRLVPAIKIEKAEDAPKLCSALVAGGLPIAEVTFRTAARATPDILLGAGTILKIEQVKKAVGAGAKFIVSPGFNPKVVDYCISNSITILPGIHSPTEIEMALDRGLKILKFFPAEASGGLAMLKAISEPYYEVRFMPTGGINAENLEAYLAFKKTFACGGSWMVKSDMIAAGQFEKITRLTAEAVAIVKKQTAVTT